MIVKVWQHPVNEPAPFDVMQHNQDGLARCGAIDSSVEKPGSFFNLLDTDVDFRPNFARQIEAEA